MSKQDRQGVRTPAQLEQKYQYGKQFAEVMGISLDTQNSVSELESALRSEIIEQMTSITRDTEQIVISALESYAETGDLEELKVTLESAMSIMADQIALDFSSTTERIDGVSDDLASVSEVVTKHFVASLDGLTISAGENTMSLVLDNDVIKFMKNGQQFGSWDGVNFYTGNIIVQVNERAQFGDFAFIPRSNKSLDFLKVGG